MTLGEGHYVVFGMNVDSRGNVVYCDHHTRSIWLIALAGLTGVGNPKYDWPQAEELVPADQTGVKFAPLRRLAGSRKGV